MTQYTFEVIATGEEFVHDVPLSEREDFLRDNPQIRQVLTPIRVVSGRPMQVDAGFRDILNRIKATSPGNKMDIPGVKTKFK